MQLTEPSLTHSCLETDRDRNSCSFRVHTKHASVAGPSPPPEFFPLLECLLLELSMEQVKSEWTAEARGGACDPRPHGHPPSSPHTASPSAWVLALPSGSHALWSPEPPRPAATSALLRAPCPPPALSKVPESPATSPGYAAVASALLPLLPPGHCLTPGHQDSTAAGRLLPLLRTPSLSPSSRLWRCLPLPGSVLTATGGSRCCLQSGQATGSVPSRLSSDLQATHSPQELALCTPGTGV